MKTLTILSLLFSLGGCGVQSDGLSSVTEQNLRKQVQELHWELLEAKEETQTIKHSYSDLAKEFSDYQETHREERSCKI